MSMSDQDESSASQQSVSDHEDRPMKKARYVWQIKGRYRLRQGRHRQCGGEECGGGGSSSLVVVRPDWPVHRWQTRQMAKAVVDNTINRVIEDMGFVPFDQDTDGLLDEAYEALESPRNPASLEDAAVMMAIQSHGLQQPKKCSCRCQETVAAASDAGFRATPFHHRPPSALRLEPRQEPPLPPSPPLNAAPPSCESSPRPSGEAEASGSDQPALFEHDFLAQAVAVAIQKKGLNAFNTDHG